MTVLWHDKNQSTVQMCYNKPFPCNIPSSLKCVGVILGLPMLFSSCFVISSSDTHLFYSTLGSWPRRHNVKHVEASLRHTDSADGAEKALPSDRHNLMLQSLAALWPF